MRTAALLHVAVRVLLAERGFESLLIVSDLFSWHEWLRDSDNSYKNRWNILERVAHQQ